MTLSDALHVQNKGEATSPLPVYERGLQNVAAMQMISTFGAGSVAVIQARFTCHLTSQIRGCIIRKSNRFATGSIRRDEKWQNHLMQ